MNILIVIPARGGSKGIPRKNLRSLAGSPLIAYSIANALASKYQPDVYVSSDDAEIRHIAQKLGAKVINRDSALAQDATTLDPVIYDAMLQTEQLEQKKYDLIVTFQPTSPLLKTQSLDEAIKYMIEHPETETTISAVNQSGLSWRKIEGRFLPNYKARLNRQYLTPIFYETGGFFISRRAIVTANSRIGENVHIYELPENEAIDIDTYEDWNLCEYYLRKKRIVISTIGYPEIGLGHIYNTLIIANEILDHELLFFVDKKSNLGYQKIASHHYQVIQQQSNNLVADLLALRPDIIINDRLDTSSEYMSALKEAGVKLINFEDLGEGAVLADLVFNPIYPEKNTLPNHYFGPSFFSARSEFLLSPTKSIQAQVKQILLTFGGVDPNNLTKKTLAAIYDWCLEQNIVINVVTGLGYQQLDSIKVFEKINLYTDVKNISDYMLKADIAFSSAGRTTYELALLGIPSIILAQNDREMTHFFANDSNGFKNLGLGIEVKKENILTTLQYLVRNFEERKLMQDLMLQYNIRDGNKRVMSIINKFLK